MAEYRETPMSVTGRGRQLVGRKVAKPQRPAKGSPASSGTKAVAQPKVQLSPEEIARRAYDIFLTRGAANGRDLDDWLQAERELTARGRNGREK
jgi:hypothetical protein